MGTLVVKPMNEVELALLMKNMLPLFNVTVTVPPATFPVRSVRKKKPPTAVTLLLVRLKTMGSNSWKVDSHVSPLSPIKERVAASRSGVVAESILREV